MLLAGCGNIQNPLTTVSQDIEQLVEEQRGGPTLLHNPSQGTDGNDSHLGSGHCSTRCAGVLSGRDGAAVCDVS